MPFADDAVPVFPAPKAGLHSGLTQDATGSRTVTVFPAPKAGLHSGRDAPATSELPAERVFPAPKAGLHSGSATARCAPRPAGSLPGPEGRAP